jgi:hypothetical protein
LCGVQRGRERGWWGSGAAGEASCSMRTSDKYCITCTSPSDSTNEHTSGRCELSKQQTTDPGRRDRRDRGPDFSGRPTAHPAPQSALSSWSDPLPIHGARFVCLRGLSQPRRRAPELMWRDTPSAGRGVHSSTFDVLRAVIGTLLTTAGLVTVTLLVEAREHAADQARIRPTHGSWHPPPCAEL